MAGVPREYVKLVAGYYEDDKIIEVGERAELLYVRSLSWCAKSLSDGTFNRHQVSRFAYGFRDLTVRITLLCRSGLWEELPEGRGYRITNWLKHNRNSEYIAARRENDRGRKRQERGAMSERTRPRTSNHVPRVETETETETGSDRTPSGSVRSEPAGAAPRGARGAAQHPPGDDVVASSSVAEAKADALKKIQEARNKNPSAGRQVFLTRRQKEQSEEYRGPSRFAEVLAEMDRRIAQQPGGDE